MDGKTELQLLPGTKKRLGIKVPGENRFLYIGSAILGAILVSMFALGRYQASLENQVKNVNEQLSALEQKRDKKGEQDLKLFKDRVAITSDLLDQHIYWTQAFSTMVGLLQSNVRFKNFSADTSTGKMSINIQAASYTALARQVASFLTEESISDLSLGKISAETAGYLETGIEIKFNKQKLLQKIK